MFNKARRPNGSGGQDSLRPKEINPIRVPAPQRDQSFNFQLVYDLTDDEIGIIEGEGQ